MKGNRASCCKKSGKNKLDTSHKLVSFFSRVDKPGSFNSRTSIEEQADQEFRACLPSLAPQHAAVCGTSERPCAPWHPAKYHCAQLCSDRSLHPPCRKENSFLLIYPSLRPAKTSVGSPHRRNRWIQPQHKVLVQLRLLLPWVQLYVE